MKRFFFLFLVSLFFGLKSGPMLMAQDSSALLQKRPYFCKDNLDTLPILAGGRVKPLLVHAKEVIHYLTDKKSPAEFSPVVTYCLLSLEGLGLPHGIELTTRVDQLQVRELLQMKDSRISFPQVLDKAEEIKRAQISAQENGPYKKELQKLLSKLSLYQNITSGRDWNLPQSLGQEVSWVPVINFLTEDKISTLAQTSSDPFGQLFLEAQENYQRSQGDKYLLEYKFEKSHLFGWAMGTVLLGIFTLVLFRRLSIGLSFAGLSVLIQLIGVTLRVLISGRAPITNMYETVMFSGLGALIIGLIIALVRKERVYVLGGLAYNLCCLLMMNFAHGMLSPSISPLVPVLRDNFWLSTHVTCIILSYSALALSWMLANFVLLKARFKGISSKETTYYSDLIYTCLKVGVVLLSAGIILGGVWADYSWGRFWGWDPKETWSLIVLLVYMAILHGKYTSWIPPKRFIPLVAGAFMSVMMAWFGVNYILATGLHSYGFSEGGAIFLMSVFGVQAFILALTYKSNVGGREAAV